MASCGTRAVLDAVFGPITDGETTYAPRLLRGLREGMIVPLDRNVSTGSKASSAPSCTGPAPS